MDRTKMIFSLLVLGTVFFSSFSMAVAAEEGEEFLKLGSKEEAISVSQNEAGAEEGVGAPGMADDSSAGFKEEDPNPVPTLENATKQEIEPTDVSEDETVEKTVPEVVVQQEETTFDLQENTPYIIVIILVVASILALFVFGIKKNSNRK